MARDFYLSWGAMYEGGSDGLYFNVVIPRIIEDLILSHGKRNVTIPDVPSLILKRGDNADIARQICENADAFQIVFIHADTGGRNLAGSLDKRGGLVAAIAQELCNWVIQRCILLAPRHEMEAWAIADAAAVCDALGYRANPVALGLPGTPEEAEGLKDPKAVLEGAMAQARGRRARIQPTQLFPAIAQRQNLEVLRRSESFRTFEAAVKVGLESMGAI